MNFIACISLFLSLHFHFVKSGPVTEAEKFGPFVTKVVQHRYISGITNDQLEYDENVIQDVRALEPKCVTQDITLSSEWSQIESKLSFQKGKLDVEFYDRLMPENIEKEATDWKFDVRFHKVAVLLYFDPRPNENTRFLTIFKIQNMGDYVFQHIRSLRRELKLTSNALARFPNKRLSRMAKEYYTKKILSKSVTEDLDVIKAEKLVVIEVKIENLEGLLISFRVMKYLDSLVKAGDSENKRNLFSEDVKEIGVSVDMVNTSDAINIVILVEMLDK